MMEAFISLGYRRECADRAQLLSTFATGAQGTAKSIKETIGKLRAEGA